MLRSIRYDQTKAWSGGELFSDLEGASITSFDFFDTLNERLAVNPLEVLTFAYQSLKTQGLVRGQISFEDFVSYRLESEKKAREESWLGFRREDCKIIEIHEKLSKTLLAKCDLRIDKFTLYSAELNAEKKLFRANPELIRIARERFQIGKLNWIVSDTPFSSEDIGAILGRERENFSRIITSGDKGLLKNTGKLWERLLADEIPEVQEFIHVGDDMASDFEKPRGLGLASLLHTGIKSQYASKSSNKPLTPSSQDLILKMEEKETKIASEPILRIQAGLGLVLAGFWASKVVDQWSRTADSSLCFVYRDGAAITDLVSDKLKNKSNSSVLHINRLTLSRLAIERDLHSYLLSMLNSSSRSTPSVSDLLKRIFGHSNSHKEVDESLIELLQANEFNKFVSEIANSNRFNRERELLRDQRSLTLDYLNQNLSKKDLNVFVDVGWHGSIQTQVEKEIREIDQNYKIFGDYLAVHEGSQLTRHNYVSRLSGPQSGHPLRGLMKMADPLIEELFSIGPPLLSYEMVANELVPLFGDSNPSISIENMIDENKELVSAQKVNRQDAVEALERFVLFPLDDEVYALSHVTHDGSLDHNSDFGKLVTTLDVNSLNSLAIMNMGILPIHSLRLCFLEGKLEKEDIQSVSKRHNLSSEILFHILRKGN